ncbi:hypothetical protein MA785_000792 [Vibrio parahaemolyticus]|nr:hypothetical protein [Vibrio parahaemolyticus]EJR2787901.1 hypothetical protein [Vibrio parahaemolyticus]
MIDQIGIYLEELLPFIVVYLEVTTFFVVLYLLVTLAEMVYYKSIDLFYSKRSVDKVKENKELFMYSMEEDYSLFLAVVLTAIIYFISPLSVDKEFCKTTNYTMYMCESKQNMEDVEREKKLIKDTLKSEISKLGIISDSYGKGLNYFVTMNEFQENYYGDFSLKETEEGNIFTIGGIKSFKEPKKSLELYEEKTFKRIRELIELLAYYEIPDSEGFDVVDDYVKFSKEIYAATGFYPIYVYNEEYYNLARIYKANYLLEKYDFANSKYKDQKAETINNAMVKYTYQNEEGEDKEIFFTETMEVFSSLTVEEKKAFLLSDWEYEMLLSII